MTDLLKAPAPFDEMGYGVIEIPNKKNNPKKRSKKIKLHGPPPPPPPAREDIWLPKARVQTSSYYHHDDRPCEPDVEVEYDVPTRESESWSACDTPAADVEKEEAIPDKTDWDFIAPGEPKPAAEVPKEPPEERVLSTSNRPWQGEKAPTQAAEPMKAYEEPVEETKPASEDIHRELQTDGCMLEEVATVTLPFSSQHKAMVYLQEVLEMACFSYGQRRWRGLLDERGWTCVEAVPLDVWMKQFLELRHTFDVQPSEELLEAVAGIQETAVKRTPICWSRMEKFLDNAVELVEILNSKEYVDIVRKVQQGMKKVAEDLRMEEQKTKNDEERKLELIAAERRRLEEREAEVLREMEKSRREHRRSAECQVRKVLEDGKETSDIAMYFLELAQV